MSNLEEHLVTHKKIQEQSTYTLINFLKNIYTENKKNILNCDENNPRNTIKELFKRILSPLYLPVLILTCMILILKSKESLLYTRYKIITLIFGLCVSILSESSVGVINNNIISSFILTSIPLILIISIYFFLRLKLR